MDLCPLLRSSQESSWYQRASVDNQICGLDNVGTANCDQFRITRARPNEVDFALVNLFQF
jgi:hypothetical protein